MTTRPAYSPLRLAAVILLTWLTLSYVRTMAGNTTPTPSEQARVVACARVGVRCGDLP